MDIKDIKALYKFLKETDLVEIEVERANGKVRLKRGGGEERAAEPSQRVAPEPTETSEATPALAGNIKTIISPMVGTFYRAPSPEAPAFVDTGSPVSKGQAVCLIEAMQIMNEIESEYAGKVVAILVENGQPVEYGEPLFQVETAK